MTRLAFTLYTRHHIMWLCSLYIAAGSSLMNCIALLLHFSLSAQHLIREQIACKHVLCPHFGKTEGASPPAGTAGVSALSFVLGLWN